MIATWALPIETSGSKTTITAGITRQGGRPLFEQTQSGLQISDSAFGARDLGKYSARLRYFRERAQCWGMLHHLDQHLLSGFCATYLHNMPMRNI